jgi:hypothetical protein
MPQAYTVQQTRAWYDGVERACGRMRRSCVGGAGQTVRDVQGGDDAATVTAVRRSRANDARKHMPLANDAHSRPAALVCSHIVP